MKINYPPFLLRLLLFFLLIGGLAGKTCAQTLSITGRVTTPEDRSGTPGVSVTVKGTTNGTVTNPSGEYTLQVPSNATLIFSYIGYAPEEVPVEGRTRIDIQLTPDVKSLSEVVVIGYGQREKRDVTGAVVEIKSDEIQKSVSMTPEVAMQGRMAGVYVASPGGDPNARPQVRIRGVGTFGFAEPLYVVDGVPLFEFGSGVVTSVSSAAASDLRSPQNVLTLINPNDIESISVLKDASAAAIYGVRAANGVVLITTKRGKEGRIRVSLDASRGVQNVAKTYQMLNTQQYTQLYQEAYASNPSEAGNLPPVFNASDPAFLGNSPTYNWQEEARNRNALIENYNLTVSGGNPISNYSVSAGYAAQESIFKLNNLKRYSFSINSDHKIKKWLEVGQTLRLAYTDAQDNRGNGLDLGTAGAPPWQPIYDPNGPGGYAANRALVGSDYRLLFGPETDFNQFGISAFSDNRYNLFRTLGSAYVTLIPLRGLRIRGSISGDVYTNDRREWNKSAPIANFRDNNPANGNTLGLRSTKNANLIREVTINYSRSFGDHGVDLVLSGSDQQFRWTGTQVSARKIQLEDPDLFQVAGNQSDRFADSFGEGAALQGYFGRLSYKFRDKYYVDATLRRDGTSKFAKDYRWGTFPSVALAWRLSGEKFMRGLTFVSDLKLRAGYGKLGNQETRAYAFLSSVNRFPRYPLGTGSLPDKPVYTQTPTIGAILPDYPVENLSWEIVTTKNIGLDAAFLNNALTATVEYYERTTTGILQAVNFPLTTGINTQPVLNIADVRNQGIELQLGYQGTLGDFRYSFSGNLTTVKNEVLSVYENQPFDVGQGRIETGYPLYYIFGYQTQGIFQTPDEVNAWKAIYSDPGNDNQKSPGDIRFADLYSPPTTTDPKGTYRNSRPDSVINERDRTYLGKTIPGFYYGINLGASYKGFDLSVLFQGVGDVQRVNNARWSGESMSSQGVNQWMTTLNRWTSTNPSTSMPRAVRSDPSGNARFSDRWVENAGFLRLSNFQFGYSLPTRLLQKLGGIERIRVYLSGNNVFVITKYTGIDPENDFNPTPRSFLLGANISF